MESDCNGLNVTESDWSGLNRLNWIEIDYKWLKDWCFQVRVYNSFCVGLRNNNMDSIEHLLCAGRFKHFAEKHY